MYTKIAKYLLIFLLATTFGGKAFASGLPDMMVGQTKVEYTGGGGTYYGGMSGNFAILNADTDSSYGFNITSTTTGLTGSGCNGVYSLQPSPLCFLIGTGLKGNGSAGTDKLMNSRLSIDTGDGNGLHVVDETPALFLGGVNISGDVFFGSPNSSSLSLWGRNLAQSGRTVDPNMGASWSISNYVQNSSSQFVCDSGSGKDFMDKILAMKGEGSSANASIYPDSVNPWYLQGNQPIYTGLMDSSQYDTPAYPQGKAWTYNGALDISKSRTYYGLGTIIVSGDLAFDSGVSITKGSGGILGFIVFGNVTFAGNNEISAPIISVGCGGSGGKMTVGSNVKLSGSYVANSFDLTGASNAQVVYDPELDFNWPPGFRYLAMPGMKPVANQ